MKADGHKWAMLTAYDYSTARIFDDAGIPVLLVGDSAANVVYGYDTTVPISVDELIPLVRGVVRARRTRSSSPTCHSVATSQDPLQRWPRPPAS
ncbi:ketopantoate hydroxymethyltransferase family protein [Mycobacterium xenopi 3993]|nr:ketopantoate hydroxymethyltransferase family protein [Mycobacterium xenopi 3993]